MSNDIKGLVLVLGFMLASAPAAVNAQGRDGIDRAEARGEKASSGDKADKEGRERPDAGGGRSPAVVETVVVGPVIKEAIEKTTEAVKESKSEWERFERETANPAPTPEPSPEATPDREDRPDRR